MPQLRQLILTIYFALPTGICVAQSTYKVSGTVTDSTSKNSVTGAVVTLKELPNKGALTNENGYFTFTVPEGTYTLVCQSMGFNGFEKKIVVNRDLTLKLNMAPEVQLQEDLVLTIDKKDDNVKTTDMGKQTLTTEEIKFIPAVFGEVDVMKALQLLPGVQSSGEGNSGLYVRGGGPDQNLVLFDDALVYNTGHLFGFFSVFNADAVESVDLYKGNIPAQYGGRLSSVVDFKMRQGDLEKWHADGGIGLISSRLTVNGPIVKDKTSFLLSGRRTYIDVLLNPFLKSGIPYYFYDINGKLTHKFSDKDQVSYSSYYGKDVASFNLLDGRFKADFWWGNYTNSLRWDHTFKDKMSMSVQGIYNNYTFQLNTQFDDFRNDMISKLNDYTGKVDFNYYISEKSNLKYGVQYSYHNFVPRKILGATSDGEFSSSTPNEKKFAREGAVYTTYETDVSDKFRVTAGLRMSYFAQLGNYNHFIDNGSTVDTVQYAKGETVRDWTGWEPRLSMRYSIDSTSSIKAAWAVSNQYMHLLSLSGNALPFDVWVPSSALVEPQRGAQYSVGYFRNFKEDLYETSAEVFYRDMKNQIEYREDFAPVLSGELERELVFGKGIAYGLELFVKKRKGNLQGWVGYTLSRTERKFDQINDGGVFPARYDRRHDLSVVGTYKLNDRLTFGGSFVLGSGMAVTIQEGRYLIEQTVVNVWGPRNGFRLPAYHRLDLSVSLYPEKKNLKYERYWNFSVYNAYNRKNAYLIYIDSEGDPINGTLKVTPKKVYIFPILLSATWNFKF